MAQVAARMPAGYAIAYANDSSDFIRLSVIEVVKTLAEAMALVILVMFVFLQSWRATLIPGIAIPVVLLGTFGMLYILGFSINTLTLFGLVLAVGLLVDDAIVVVENVERILHEQPGTDHQGSDDHVDGPDPDGAGRDRAGALGGVPADGLLRRLDGRHLSPVLGDDRLGDGAVGSAGADLQSVARGERAAAASTASVEETWLGKRAPGVAHAIETARQKFNTASSALIDWYVGNVGKVVERKWLFLRIYVGVCAAAGLLFLRLPTGFIPTEDQGNASVQFRLPAGATFGRTQQVEQAVEQYFLHGPEKKNVAHLLRGHRRRRRGFPARIPARPISISRRSISARVRRTAREAIVDRASGAFRGLRDAQVFALVPGAIRGLGQSAGFTMELQNTSGMSREQFAAARDRLLAAATCRSGAGAGPAQRTAGRRQPQGQYRPAASRRARPHPE